MTCFASDLTGNTGSTTVEIRVKGAGEQMAELQADAERIRAVAGC